MMLQKTNWPPDYIRIWLDRKARYGDLISSPAHIVGAIEYYRTRPVEFIEDWCQTFDPRNAGTDKPTRLPLILFPRQRDFIEFLHECVKGETGGLVEKSRDMGATWLAVSFSVWLFLFVPGATVGWGSRKEALVDRIGDMSSIFEKIRFQLRSIPRQFWPVKFNEDNMSFMRIWAASGESITGESGDDIGRGGRTLIYFKDESAHYEHPEAIEAALSDNTRVQIDISSVNGLGNVFHRKREGGVEWEPGKPAQRGKTNVFIMDWSDHPDKTHAWYSERQARAIDDGLLHIFRQEVDRNYAASVEGVVIPADWVKSAIDAHERLGFSDESKHACYAGLDVADGGGDRNAMAIREGVTLRSVEQWGERDTGLTTRRALDAASVYARKGRRVKVQYDSVGVGAGVKSESNRLADDNLMPKHVVLTSWNAGAQVLEPDDRVVENDDESPMNKDFYANLKAQAWWQLRLRFERTHRAVEANDPRMYAQDELISLPSDLPLLRTLQKELSQPTMSKNSRMKLVIDKQPERTKSPNLADAVVMAYWPVDSFAYDTSFDWL
jgi:phage terminase large subunit